MTSQALEIARHLNAEETTSRAWDLTVVDAGEGWARVRMPAKPDMLNGHGMVHGGLIFAVADTAFAYACNSRNETSVAYHASITFLAPVRPGDILEAEAREETRSGRSGVYSVAVTNQSGETVAVFNGVSRTRGAPIL